MTFFSDKKSGSLFINDIILQRLFYNVTRQHVDYVHEVIFYFSWILQNIATVTITV